LLAIVRDDEVCRRLMTIPGVGPVVALTYRATVERAACRCVTDGLLKDCNTPPECSQRTGRFSLYRPAEVDSFPACGPHSDDRRHRT
jgi:hypothetical protein